PLLPCFAVSIRRFRAALARFERAPGQPFDASEKAVVAERPSDALRGAQRCEQFLLWRRVEQVAEAGKAIPDRSQCRQAVVFAAQMRARARPSPVLRPL